MPKPLEYDHAIEMLQGALQETTVNAKAFRSRGAGAPEILSARSWTELAEIEQILAGKLKAALERVLRAPAWTLRTRIGSGFGSFFGAIGDEEREVKALFQRACAECPDQYDPGERGLETDLWPFWIDRTHHLANTAALALVEPAPYPALVWHARERAFRR